MNIHELATLVEVIDRGSLAAAAETLDVTPSAVSRRISRLEEELGVELLLRSTRRVVPTEAGRRVLEHARSAVEAAQRTRDAAREERAEATGLVRFLSLMAFGRLHLTALIEEVRRAHPRLDLDLVFDDRRQRALAGDFDIALVAGLPRSDRLFVSCVAELRSVVCAPPSYVEGRDAPQTPADLEVHDCLLYSYSGSPDTWVLRRDGEVHEVRVTGSVRANNSEVVADLLRRGLGVGRVPEFIAAPLIASGELVDLFPGYQMATMPLYLATQQSRPLPRRIRAVYDILAEGLRRSPWESVHSEGVRSNRV